MADSPLTLIGLKWKPGKISMFDHCRLRMASHKCDLSGGTEILKNACSRLMHLLRQILLTVLCLLPLSALAAEDYLEPEQAFQLSAVMTTPQLITVTYRIADGYYMYRERFRFTAEGGVLGAPSFPPGKVKFDETFQKNVETYRQLVQIRIPVDAQSGLTLTVAGQGCADAGLCYAPMESVIKLSPAGGLLAAARQVNSENAQLAPSAALSVVPITEMGQIETALKSGRLLLVIPLFLLLGLGLSFTPCVLPMVPILSSIIVGEGVGIRRGRGFLLSVSYSLGMAVVYTGLGIAAGLIGEGLSAALQNPWVLGSFALLMIGLALSMFGVYQLQVPSSLQQKLMLASDRQRPGKLFGVFVMGALSALIVGPCVAAPLAGALVYISQSRDVLIGGSALFAMAMGMSVPLLLLGLSAGTLLPRAGAWMEDVKKFFGVLMLGVALWMISPVIPAVFQLLGWAALGIGYGTYLLGRQRRGWFAKAIGLVFAVVGVVQLVGVASGGRDALAPLAHWSSTPTTQPVFTRIHSVAELDAVLLRHPGKVAMLDFYADWCVSCKEMEKLTFSHPVIKAQLGEIVLLQADVTANTADDKALLKRFTLFGPPGIIFFRNAVELPNTRVIGYQDATRFGKTLSQLVSP